MKHLVLGSEGQIGKYVCEEIERNGDVVMRWDVKLGQSYDLTHLNGDDSELIQAVRDSDFVHFLAFDVGGAKYLAKHQNSFEYLRNNLNIMYNTFNVLRLVQKPFYFASSQMSNMYSSVYGRLKAIGEAYTQASGGISVKFWNVYGYESDPEKTHVITDFIKSALTEKRVICMTDGTEERHFTHARDAAKMLYRVATRYNEIRTSWKFDGNPIAITTNPDYGWWSIKRVADFIAKIVEDRTGDKVDLFFSDKKDTTQSHKNKVDKTWAYDSYLCVDESNPNFCFREIELKEGLKEMVDLIAKDLNL